MRSLLSAILVLAGSVAHATGLDEANAGLAAAQRGDDDAALQHYSAALAAGDMSPNNVMLAYHNRGNTYQDKGEYRRAIPEYDIAIKLQPRYAEAWFARGRARLRSVNLATPPWISPKASNWIPLTPIPRCGCISRGARRRCQMPASLRAMPPNSIPRSGPALCSASISVSLLRNRSAPHRL